MAQEIARGDIWLFRFAPPDKRRPVLILSRPSLLGVLRTATVVAITSTLRDSPTEVELGEAEGLKRRSSANLANIFTVPQRELRRYVGSVGPEKMRHICRALLVACGCD
jgi:mRNA interferase MazF